MKTRAIQEITPNLNNGIYKTGLPYILSAFLVVQQVAPATLNAATSTTPPANTAQTTTTPTTTSSTYSIRSIFTPYVAYVAYIPPSTSTPTSTATVQPTSTTASIVSSTTVTSPSVIGTVPAIGEPVSTTNTGAFLMASPLSLPSGTFQTTTGISTGSGTSFVQSPIVTPTTIQLPSATSVPAATGTPGSSTTTISSISQLTQTASAPSDIDASAVSPTSTNTSTVPPTNTNTGSGTVTTTVPTNTNTGSGTVTTTVPTNTNTGSGTVTTTVPTNTNTGGTNQTSSTGSGPDPDIPPTIPDIPQIPATNPDIPQVPNVPSLLQSPTNPSSTSGGGSGGGSANGSPFLDAGRSASEASVFKSSYDDKDFVGGGGIGVGGRIFRELFKKLKQLREGKSNKTQPEDQTANLEKRVVVDDESLENSDQDNETSKDKKNKGKKKKMAKIKAANGKNPQEAVELAMNAAVNGVQKKGITLETASVESAGTVYSFMPNKPAEGINPSLPKIVNTISEPVPIPMKKATVGVANRPSERPVPRAFQNAKSKSRATIYRVHQIADRSTNGQTINPNGLVPNGGDIDQ